MFQNLAAEGHEAELLGVQSPVQSQGSYKFNPTTSSSCITWLPSCIFTVNQTAGLPVQGRKMLVTSSKATSTPRRQGAARSFHALGLHNDHNPGTSPTVSRSCFSYRCAAVETGTISGRRLDSILDPRPPLLAASQPQSSLPSVSFQRLPTRLSKYRTGRGTMDLVAAQCEETSSSVAGHRPYLEPGQQPRQGI